MCGGETSAYDRVGSLAGSTGPDFVRNIASDNGFSRSGVPGQEGESLTGPNPNDGHTFETSSFNYYVHFEGSYRYGNGAINFGTLTYGPYQSTQFRDFQIQFYLSSKGKSLQNFNIKIIDVTGTMATITIPVKTRNGEGNLAYDDGSSAWELLNINLSSQAGGVTFPASFNLQFEATSLVATSNSNWDADWAIDNVQFSAQVVECTVDTDCTGTNTRCQSNECTCNAFSNNLYYVERAGTSGATLSCQAAVCRTSNDCAGANTMCNTNSYTCQCLADIQNTNTYYAFVSGSGRGYTCITVQCKTSCSGSNTRCVSNTCQCLANTDNNKYVQAQNTGGANLVCNVVQCASNADCTTSSGGNTFCNTQDNTYQCQCNSGKFITQSGSGTSGLRCRAVQCASNDHCTTNSGGNTFCNTNSYLCQCNNGNFITESGSNSADLRCRAVACLNMNDCSGNAGNTVCNTNNYQCECRSGLYVRDNNQNNNLLTCTLVQCINTDDCTGDNTQCSNNFCECLPGKYVVDSNSGSSALNCRFVECATNSDCTGANAFCNLNALVCACPANYYRSVVNGLTECEPYECVTDIDCLSAGSRSTCRQDSNTCACEGAFLEGITDTTTGILLTCIEYDCLQDSHCTGNATYCDTNARTCRCASNLYVPLAGMTGRNLMCVLVDSCATTTCNANARCVVTGNQPGPTCVCNSGYVRRTGTLGLGTICDDINECQVNPPVCHPTALCQNSEGSYNCYCNQGFNYANNKCYRNGGYGPWINEGECSEPCGTGTQIQFRICINPSREQGGGLDCVNGFTDQQNIPCNVHPCSQGCTRNKPRSKCLDARQYTTGLQPDSSYSFTNELFVNAGPISRNDPEEVKALVETYTSSYIKQKCKEAACDDGRLEALKNEIEAAATTAKTTDNRFSVVRSYLQDIIDCNGNIEIESQLWDVYDDVCDKCVCVHQITNDLEAKQHQVLNEMERCKGRDWYSAMMEKMTKNW